MNGVRLAVWVLLALLLVACGFKTTRYKINRRELSQSIITRGNVKIEDESYLSRIEDEDELSKRIDRPVWLNIFSSKKETSARVIYTSCTLIVVICKP